MMKQKSRILAFILCLAMLSTMFLTATASAQPQAEITFNGQPVNVTSSGAISQDGLAYTIEKDFVLTFDEAKATFNQFSLDYSSTQPLRCEITYSNVEGQGAEEFFLEAGDNLTFSQLIDGYLDGRKQTQIDSIRFSIIADSQSVLTVNAINTAEREILDTAVAYLENERYKVGINLAWGGGVSYLEDKMDGDESITNLFNHYDTGRLVQQSYYGTTEPPYVPGEYMGNVWAYNPVQGGDKNNNASKIVDFYVKDNEIYIKARPLDWAWDNQYTYVYMENIYTLREDGIEVYNSVIDFSNYDNPKRNQELPAFYTISYLNNFYYYNGDAPWTGDTLTKRSDLPFWGDHRDGDVTYNPGNTETWTAWVDDNDWGVGLYVPNTTHLTSGRYMYDGSKDPAAQSTNYVAPLRQMMLIFGQKIEYSYYITTGSIDEIRTTFTEHKDFTTNEKLDQNFFGDMDYRHITFTREIDRMLFTNKNECSVTIKNGFALLTAQNLVNNDPYAQLDLTGCDASLKAEDYPYIVFTYMAPDTNSSENYTGQIFFGAGAQMNPSGEASKTFPVTSDGQLHSQIIDLTGQTYWQGKPNFARLDFFSSAAEGDCMYVKSFRMASTLEEAEAIANEEQNPVTVSVQAVDEEGNSLDSAVVSSSFHVQAVTKDDAQSIALFNENGMKMGLQNLTKEVQENGSIRWDFDMSIGTRGASRTFTLCTIDSEGVYHPMDAQFSIAIVAPDAQVKSVTTVENTVVGKEFPITVVTNEEAQKLVVTNEAGLNMGILSYSYEDTADGRIWTVNIKVQTAGTRTFTIAAKNRDGVLCEGMDTEPVTIGYFAVE